MAEKVERIKLLPHLNFTRAFTSKVRPNMVSTSRVRRLFHSIFPRGFPCGREEMIVCII